MNHVFVDFENVHEVDFAIFSSKPASLVLLLGAKQTKLEVGIVEKLLEYAASVQLIRLTSSGKNALDFALSYYLGRAVLADPAAYFHIVSGDTGFDPLIAHLRSRNIQARRHADFSTLTFKPSAKPTLKPAPGKTAPAPKADPMTRALEHLRKNTSNRPKRKTTLVSHLTALLGRTADEAGVLVLIGRLCEQGHLSLDDKDKVTYHL